ncbi:hypothetical protein EMIT019CA3_20335 [Bacillus pseudomycoides]|nr:hypothetical protein COL70_18535 [Bacillus pseudomycoides]PHD16979.1 hypothetical protein COF46_11485 [Bacillus pseudomycoides]
MLETLSGGGGLKAVKLLETLSGGGGLKAVKLLETLSGGGGLKAVRLVEALLKLKAGSASSATAGNIKNFFS